MRRPASGPLRSFSISSGFSRSNNLEFSAIVATIGANQPAGRAWGSACQFAAWAIAANAVLSVCGWELGARSWGLEWCCGAALSISSRFQVLIRELQRDSIISVNSIVSIVSIVSIISIFSIDQYWSVDSVPVPCAENRCFPASRDSLTPPPYPRHPRYPRYSFVTEVIRKVKKPPPRTG